MAWTTPSTASVGGAVTAALWNSDVRDNMTALAPLFGTWTSWTPTSVTQGVALTGTYNNQYLIVGNLAIVRFEMLITSTGTLNSVLYVNLPAVLAKRNVTAAYAVSGVGTYYTGNRVPFFPQFNNSTTQLRFKPTTTTADDQLGSHVVTQMQNAHSFDFLAMYEVAV